MPRRLMIPMSLILSVALASCSDDGAPSSPRDSGERIDRGLVYQDMDPSHDAPSTSDSVKVDLPSGGDVGAKTDGEASHDLPPKSDLPSTLDGAVSCVKNSFIGCQGQVLIRCDASGKPENISCSPYLCNITAQRCNECDTTKPTTCSGAFSISCGQDGLVAAKLYCKLGCDATTGLCKGCLPKTYYRDGDKDTYGDPATTVQACTQPQGYVLNKLDCDDNDANTHPGQTKYFTTPSKGKKSFDYNCDGKETKHWIFISKCFKGCSFEGWDNTVAACGVKAPWTACLLDPFDHYCDDHPDGDRTQACR